MGQIPAFHRTCLFVFIMQFGLPQVAAFVSCFVSIHLFYEGLYHS